MNQAKGNQIKVTFINETNGTGDDNGKSVYEGQRFRNFIMDALNIDNSLLTSLGKDVRSSLMPYYVEYTCAAGGNSLIQKQI